MTAPYIAVGWLKALTDQPEQKASGIAAWMAGLAAYLNKVGHHRDRADRDVSGDLAIMPTDFWEAEIAVASAQMAIAYLLRLRSSSAR